MTTNMLALGKLQNGDLLNAIQTGDLDTIKNQNPEILITQADNGNSTIQDQTRYITYDESGNIISAKGKYGQISTQGGGYHAGGSTNVEFITPQYGPPKNITFDANSPRVITDDTNSPVVIPDPLSITENTLNITLENIGISLSNNDARSISLENPYGEHYLKFMVDENNSHTTQTANTQWESKLTEAERKQLAKTKMINTYYTIMNEKTTITPEEWEAANEERETEPS